MKIGHLAKAIAHAKLKPIAYANDHFESKIKNAINMRKTNLIDHLSCSVQKTARKKHQIYEKCKNRPSSKGYSPCKGYSLCKMVSFPQKLKMPKTYERSLYKNIRVLLCKKPLEKAPNIGEMRRL